MKTNHKKIIYRTFLIGIILALPTLLTTVFSDQICDSYSFFSPCAWTSAVLLICGYIFLWIGSEIYLIILYRRPKLYRAFMIVGLSIFTLFVLLLFLSSIKLSIDDITIPVIIFLAVIYPLIHLIYYWLFNSFLPRFAK